MEVKLVQIEEDLIIGGFSIESIINYEEEQEKLYKEFIHNGRMTFLDNIKDTYN